MKSERRPVSCGMQDSETLSGKFEEEFPVPACVVLFVEPSRLEEDLSREKRGLLHYHHSGQRQPPETVRRGQAAPDALPALVDVVAIAIYNVGTSVAEKLRGFVQRTRQQQVVGIEVSQNLAGRPRESFIQPLRGTVVRLEDRLAEPRPIFLDDLTASVA